MYRVVRITEDLGKGSVEREYVFDKCESTRSARAYLDGVRDHTHNKFATPGLKVEMDECFIIIFTERYMFGVNEDPGMRYTYMIEEC